MKNHAALITGASGGIGFEIAKLLAPDHSHLVLADIREDALEKAGHAIRSLAPDCEVIPLVLDLAQIGAAEHVFSHPRLRELEISTLVNNAGFGTFGLFQETDWEKESRMLQLHVLTLTHLTKLVLPGMIARKQGRILNVASVAGFQPSPLMAVYNASKAYVLSFSEALTNEVKGTGVSVTVLCPGLTPTGFQAGVGVGKPEMTANKWISSSADFVGRKAITDLKKGKTISIPGRINYLLANAHRFLPRNTVTAMVRKVQEKNRSFLKKGPD